MGTLFFILFFGLFMRFMSGTSFKGWMAIIGFLVRRALIAINNDK